MGIKAVDLMTRKLVTLSPEMTLKQMDAVLLKRGVSGAPVVEMRRLIGVASQVDVMRSLYDDQVAASRISGFQSSPFPIPLPALETIRNIGEQLIPHFRA